jgi:tRNA threonylcarbamoyladenosine modification (KEOPS) complex Cgi121 subunit
MLTVKKIVPLSMFHQEMMKSQGFVGIDRIQFQSIWKNQESLILSIQSVEEENVHIQIFNSENIISLKHLYYAVYFAEQAFTLSSNISNRKSIEYLIYASFQRQIKNAIEAVGFLINDSHNEYANIVITAPTKKKIASIYPKLLSALNAVSVKETKSSLTQTRIDHFKFHFQITDFELINALRCMGFPSGCTFTDQDEESKINAFLYVITEKMAQLLMENFKVSN